MSLFRQDSFTGGIDNEFDPTKLDKNSYPLLINGRCRRNVISPTRKHINIPIPEGNLQSIYAAGDIIVVFISGIAYYVKIDENNANPFNLVPLAGWTPLDASVKYIYAEIVPATSNLFNRIGAPEDIAEVFNNTINITKQALFVFDGINQPRAIFPDGSFRDLGVYEQWTKNNPEYVPIGILPTMGGSKLFLVSPDKQTILSSVSGRTSDFVINIDAFGNKGGDAYTVSATVSFNDITSIKALSTGNMLVSTLYGTFALNLDYSQLFFGEPYLNPVFLFPSGAVNHLSSISISAQTVDGVYLDNVFITQSGIHGFNATAQAQRESNNAPIGAKIKHLLTNPQSDTCAINYDDYGLFAVNTIHGRGVLVYDTLRRAWVSLDISFGNVKQFANTKLNGQDRLFFITHDNKLFEAFASDQVNTCRVYIGDWAPTDANTNLLLYGAGAAFVNIRTAGNVKYSVFIDNELKDEVVLQVTSQGYTDNYPIPLPYTNALKSIVADFTTTTRFRGWNVGVMAEWDFDGELSVLSIEGDIETSENPDMSLNVVVEKEKFAFFGESGSRSDLNTGGEFHNGYTCIDVIKGNKYQYFPVTNGRLVSGSLIIKENSIFTANGDNVSIEGCGDYAFSLKDITNFWKVLAAIPADVTNYIGGGNHSYHFGTGLDVATGAFPIKANFFPACGDIDFGNNQGREFFNFYGVRSNYTLKKRYVEFFFYNSCPDNPDGVNIESKQAAWLKLKLKNSTALYKIVVISRPPYSTSEEYSPGVSTIRLPFQTWGANAIISGAGGVMERFIIQGFPYFVCGTGGAYLSPYAPGTNNVASFRNNATYGYLKIEADPLVCRFTFINTDNIVLDSYAIYS